MCRVPKVLLVAPPELHAELRRKLASISYEVAAAAVPGEETSTITADVAVLWQPAAAEVEAQRALDRKVVAVGSVDVDADLVLGAEDVGAFKERIWELFRAR